MLSDYVVGEMAHFRATPIRSYELDGEKSSFARPIIDVIGEYTTFVERIIEKGQASREFTADMDPKLLSLNILGQLFGNTIPWILNRDKTNYRVIITSQKEMVLKALIDNNLTK